jgi:hypothetical protein
MLLWRTLLLWIKIKPQIEGNDFGIGCKYLWIKITTIGQFRGAGINKKDDIQPQIEGND